MQKTIVTPATELPVSLEEFKAHARIDGETEDGDISLKLAAAVAHVENDLNRPLITSTWDLHFERWPYFNLCTPKRNWLDLLGNTQSVTWLKFYDSLAALQTVSSSTYRLVRQYTAATDGESDAGEGRLYLALYQSWPSDTLDVGEPIVARVVAGWKDASSVPAPIKAAIHLIAGHLYRNREAVVVGNLERISAPLAMAAESLLAPYRIWKF